MSATCPPITNAKYITYPLDGISADYGTTPGGTLFAATPGGTRIMYDRSFLLQCRNSPLAKSPIKNLPKIPGVTCPLGAKEERNSSDPEDKVSEAKQAQTPKSAAVTPGSPAADDPQFQLDF